MKKSPGKSNLSNLKYKSISLSGELLNYAYGVYIIKVKRKEEEFILAETIEAQLPINKLAYHLQYNRIATGIFFIRMMTALKIKTPEEMQLWFTSSVITFYFYKTDE
ncbi:MAG: hypothetical protein ABI855_18275, partial [Bacteroidota bacterium]